MNINPLYSKSEAKLKIARIKIFVLTFFIKTNSKAAKSEESIVKMKGELQEATEKSISLREEKVKIEAEAHELLIYLEKIDVCTTWCY